MPSRKTKYFSKDIEFSNKEIISVSFSLYKNGWKNLINCLPIFDDMNSRKACKQLKDSNSPYFVVSNGPRDNDFNFCFYIGIKNDSYFLIDRKIEFKIFNPSLHKCDARCTNAKGHNCECSCGGKNHGINF